MAIAAVTSYAQTQNGDHQVAVVDDALAKTPVAIIDGPRANFIGAAVLGALGTILFWRLVFRRV